MLSKRNAITKITTKKKQESGEHGKPQKKHGFYAILEPRIILTGKFTVKNERIAFPLGFYSETCPGHTRATDSGSERALTGTEEKIYRTHTDKLFREQRNIQEKHIWKINETR